MTSKFTIKTIRGTHYIYKNGRYLAETRNKRDAEAHIKFKLDVERATKKKKFAQRNTFGMGGITFRVPKF